MRYILIILSVTLSLMASVIRAPIVSVDEANSMVSIKVAKVDVGVSGFLVHTIAQDHTSILNNLVVTAYDAQTKIATLKMSKFTALDKNSLPSGKWKAQVGDHVVLAFAYSRALLIAPSEEIYHRITKAVKVEWVHPDIFATILSYHGHPTPLREDFLSVNIGASVGLLFIYLDKSIYTIDIKSFVILSVSDAPLVQDETDLPFYSRVEHIEANWWGEGSDELSDYESYYYGLLVQANKTNKTLYENIKKSDDKNHFLLDEFELGE